MKKLQKDLKLKLNRETLIRLDHLDAVVAGVWVKTVDATYCASNCLMCTTTLCP